MTNNQQENEFTRLINLNQISKSGLEMMLTTSDAECEKLAERFSILKIESVVAKCSIKKLAQKDTGDYLLSVEMKAEVIQQCIMTLEDINESIDERFNVIFQIVATDEDENRSTIVDFEVDDEDLELILETEIDLGGYVAEYLSLSLDPYPRKGQVQGDELGYKILAEDEVSERSEKKNPFNVLKDLKHKT
ncbi:MAG: DUF177 domain-containing protein [Kordiimonadaceae bacterium]|jgi:uncharacterized metal-binding protein YceD (DUF177 family)|nr:DUF177 domain-containing protein [Kordiimonadaceae bacterium]MBT6035419.1 DUF177 domain-containing protein [Kordiimonadaceae bacterium]MBT6330695.1 DUF177 domain-containing protein [Kordiimonadaceae bacterium]MBT7581774.1 DUF177 domain-containing protein [Kordiimonadaceae bacterium]